MIDQIIISFDKQLWNIYPASELVNRVYNEVLSTVEKIGWMGKSNWIHNVSTYGDERKFYWSAHLDDNSEKKVEEPGP